LHVSIATQWTVFRFGRLLANFLVCLGEHQMDSLPPVIALDIGHSAVKVRAAFDGRREQLIFPSVVTHAIHISEEGAARSAELETVRVRDRAYFFGRTAIVQGGAEVETGMTEGWIQDYVHHALILGALKKLAQKQPPINTDGAIVALGLPAKFYSKQKEQLIQICRELIPTAIVQVMPQPLGPYFTLQYDSDGLENRRHKPGSESWAIIEVGHFTTDFALIKEGDWIERGSNSSLGASSAVQHLQRLIEANFKVSVTLLDATRAMEQGFIMLRGDKVDLTAQITEASKIFCEEVIPFAQRLWGREALSLNGVIVAGGGANLVRDAVLAAFGTAFDSGESRFAVAEGFLRACLAAARARAMSQARKSQQAAKV
jgi:plasmid segregation protein ParM